MTYKEDIRFIATQIVKSKGHHVYCYWSENKKDVFSLIKSLNEKIKKEPGMNKVKDTEKALFSQQEFEF